MITPSHQLPGTQSEQYKSFQTGKGVRYIYRVARLTTVIDGNVGSAALLFETITPMRESFLVRSARLAMVIKVEVYGGQYKDRDRGGPQA
jgi:hypothetical protein